MILALEILFSLAVFTLIASWFATSWCAPRCDKHQAWVKHGQWIGESRRR